MVREPTLLLVLDLTGTFAFAVNGALAAVRAAKLDIVGVVTLGMVTALGGGILRDIIIDDLPPATFRDWRYLAVAAAGGLLVFAVGRRLDRFGSLITVLDAAGLALFAVTGASKAFDFGLGTVQAVILGGLTAAGGGTLRDMLLGQIPTVLRRELYVVPALLAATIAVVALRAGLYGVPAAVLAALAGFALRMLAVRFKWNAPSMGGPPPDVGPSPAAGAGDA
ncbi:MAG: trimeric intracellular cation channel family protein [Acidimicrobiales bacterium]